MNKEKQKGITLIALIITIIVMLILVSVSVNVAINSNLFANAKRATEEWKKSEENEMNIGGNIDETLAEIRKVTLYFEKPEQWEAKNIFAYVWKNDGSEYKPWPGVKAELIEGTENIYKYEVPESYVGNNIIFNIGRAEFQTVDLKMPGDGNIFIPDKEEGRSVYYKAEKEGFYKVNIYMWNSITGEKEVEFPGIQLQKLYSTTEVTTGAGVYKYELPEKYDYFIFSHYTEDGQKLSQSNDILFQGGNKRYYQDGKATIYTDGKWETYKGIK